MISRVWVWALVVPCVLGGLLTHPEACVAQDEALNSLYDGAWAVQFRISENFTLSTFSGSIISIKRHYSERSALRAGLSLSLAALDAQSDRELTDTTITSNHDSNAYSVRLELQYMRYTNPQGRLSPYWGVGPLVGYGDSSSKDSFGGDTFKRDSRAWELGLIGSLGVEWFPARYIGLHAEYGLSFTYNNQKDTRKSPSGVQTDKSTVWRFGGEGVLFGLSIYF